MNSLESSAITVSDAMEAIRSGWGVLHRIEECKPFSHMFKCVEIAIQSQCRLFPIIMDDNYNGCVLLGTVFSIVYRSVEVFPLEYSELLLLLRVKESKSRNMALKRIIEMLVPYGGNRERLEDAKIMRSLAKDIRNLPLNEETRHTLSQHVVQLSFPEKNLSINANNITNSLDMIMNSVMPPDEYPLHPSMPFETDLISNILAGYGYTSFTFNIPSCPTIILEGNPQVPKTFVVRNVILSTAIQDMKNVIQSRRINNNPNFSKVHRGKELFGKDKEEVFRKLLRVACPLRLVSRLVT